MHDIGHAEEPAVADDAAKKRVADRHGRAAGEQEGDAARHAEHAEGADERRHPEARDKQPVDDARHGRRRATPPTKPSSTAAGRGERGRHGVDRVGRDDGGEAHDEAYREVDAAGDDDEGLAGREQQRRHREDRDRLEVEGVKDEGAAELGARPGLEPDDQRGEKQPGPQVGDALDERPGVLRVVGLRLDVPSAGAGVGR